VVARCCVLRKET